jgi:hypothetical protein
MVMVVVVACVLVVHRYTTCVLDDTVRCVRYMWCIYMCMVY